MCYGREIEGAGIRIHLGTKQEVDGFEQALKDEKLLAWAEARDEHLRSLGWPPRWVDETLPYYIHKSPVVAAAIEAEKERRASAAQAQQFIPQWQEGDEAVAELEEGALIPLTPEQIAIVARYTEEFEGATAMALSLGIRQNQLHKQMWAEIEGWFPEAKGWEKSVDHEQGVIQVKHKVGQQPSFFDTLDGDGDVKVNVEHLGTFAVGPGGVVPLPEGESPDGFAEKLAQAIQGKLKRGGR